MSSRQTALMMSLAIVVLLLVGLFGLTSTSVHAREHSEPFAFLKLQSKWLALGLFAAVFFAVVDYRRWRNLWWLAYGGSVFLLILTLFPQFHAEINGEARWLKLGGFQFQSSETAKISVMLALAAWFSQRSAEVKSFWKGFVIPAAMLALPVLLIFVQTDMGTAVCLAAAGGVVLFMAGVRLRYILIVVLLAAGGLAATVYQNENRKARVVAMFFPDTIDDPQERRDRMWQQDRAAIAIKNGGVFGLGLAEGRESAGQLPYAHTDFIFAAVGEEMGLIATLGIVFCYLFLLLGATKVAANIKDEFGLFLSMGLGASILVPALLNMMVVTGIVPNSGLPLPMLSYGGTNLVFTLAAFGLLLSVCLHGPAETKEEDISALQPNKLSARL